MNPVPVAVASSVRFWYCASLGRNERHTARAVLTSQPVFMGASSVIDCTRFWSALPPVPRTLTPAAGPLPHAADLKLYIGGLLQLLGCPYFAINGPNNAPNTASPCEGAAVGVGTTGGAFVGTTVGATVGTCVGVGVDTRVGAVAGTCVAVAVVCGTGGAGTPTAIPNPPKRN